MNRPLRLTSLLFALFSTLIFSSATAQDKLWSEANSDNLRQNLAGRAAGSLPEHYRLIRLNTSVARQLQAQAPVEDARTRAFEAAVPFEIPLPNGELLKSSFYESPILSRELQRQLRNVKTYEVTNGAKTSLGRLTITPDGVTGLLFTDKGTVYINPVGKENPDVHMVYYVKDLKSTDPTICGAITELADKRTTRTTFGDCQLRTYRLAVAATGEFTGWAIDQAGALTSITTTINNVSAIYQRDLTVRFTLVSTNAIIYTNAATDPHPTVGFPDSALLTKNDSAIDQDLGFGNYDIGIVFNRAWNGGVAQLVSTCGANKARAAAGFTQGQGAIGTLGPQGPIFENLVAHEMGHQFGATHTMSASNGSCGPNVTGSTAFEPGGGSTIMAYAASCNPNFYQFQSDQYFHAFSLFQMTNFIAGAGGTCPVTTPTGNGLPVVNPEAYAYSIPLGTPFSLTAVGNDPDGDQLYYSWEQLDANGSYATPPVSTDEFGPLFRSWPATTNPTRTFPRLKDLIFGAANPYEVLPTVARDMNFAISARDFAPGGGCTGHDDFLATVTTIDAIGPFVVTSQPTPITWTADGVNTATITWDVANTTAAPVSCAAVHIQLSVDGGYTYPYTLATATANDGSEVITIPNYPTTVGRIRVQASNNIFFNINAADITITSSCNASGVTVTPSAPVSGNAGSASLDLSLSPLYGSPVNITGTIDMTDTYAQLVLPAGSAAGPCGTFANYFFHETHQFVVSVGGTYTFSRAPGTPTSTVYHLYEGNINPGDPCLDRIASSAFTGPTTHINIVVDLLPGIVYTMAVGSFSRTTPAMPFNYTINVAGPGGIFTGPVNPAGFNYTYVVVDNATGDIVAIDPSADLSNGTTFPMGQYTIYGLSYSNSISPATLNTYVGGPFSDLQNDALFSPGTFCSMLSANTVPVNILASLPAEMLPLKASKANNAVLLKWGTANESNTSHFEVLRSTNGVNFETVIGTVAAQGSSNQVINYSFTDQTPAYGINYYRVRLKDLDGKTTLSNIANIEMSTAITLAAVYPNPAKAAATLEYISGKAGAVQVTIMDSKGAIVQKFQFNAQAGRNIRALQVAGFAKGIYAVQITDGEGVIIKRFVKE